MQRTSLHIFAILLALTAMAGLLFGQADLIKQNP
jgi:hypothetical protein